MPDVAQASLSSYSTTTTPKAWIFIFLQIGCSSFYDPNRMRASYFCTFTVGDFFTTLLAAYLFFFSAKILRLYASFKRRLFTYIILLTKKDNWPLSFEFFTLGPYFSPICVQDPFLSHLHYSFFSWSLTKIEVALGNTQHSSVSFQVISRSQMEFPPIQ